ncbi:hypothetical protein TNCV_722171 [Trichonephila clavipes]|nr:hypothetical protein TNCV_722171 [Trichonephila clavipes]
MKRFKSTDLVDVHLIYELAERNVRSAERLYRERYPQNDTAEQLHILYNLHHNLCEYGLLRSNRQSQGGSCIPSGHSIQPIFSLGETKCVRYSMKEYEYHVGSSNHSWPALTMPITS